MIHKPTVLAQPLIHEAPDRKPGLGQQRIQTTLLLMLLKVASFRSISFQTFGINRESLSRSNQPTIEPLIELIDVGFDEGERCGVGGEEIENF